MSDEANNATRKRSTPGEGNRKLRANLRDHPMVHPLSARSWICNVLSPLGDRVVAA
jgi:hypothetical protein